MVFGFLFFVGFLILWHQLLLFGRLARAAPDNPLRVLTFILGSTDAATGRYIRNVGRPRNEWAVMLKKASYRMDPDFHNIISNELAWKRAVYMYRNWWSEQSMRFFDWQIGVWRAVAFGVSEWNVFSFPNNSFKHDSSFVLNYLKWSGASKVKDN